jgi:hypothetical protein
MMAITTLLGLFHTGADISTTCARPLLVLDLSLSSQHLTANSIDFSIIHSF